MSRAEETTPTDPLKDLSAKLISVTEASQISGLSTAFIRRMLQRSQIAGVKIGRNWLTTREAIQAYLKTERRPGPKPKQPRR